MKTFFRIIKITFFTGLGLCILLIAITATTKFEYRKNPMTQFFAQHNTLDSIALIQKIPLQLARKDIDFLIKTIEEVHPNPYHNITQNEFYTLADSIKHTIKSDIERQEFFDALTSLVSTLRDGHTKVLFPEISDGQDNVANFEEGHEDNTDLLIYKPLNTNTGYLQVKDFVMNVADFKIQLAQIFEQIQDDSVSNLIIDVQNCPGGNTELVEWLISYLRSEPYKGNSKIEMKRSEQYYEYIRGYFVWWSRPFIPMIKQLNDYKNTPVGDLYVEVKGNKSIMPVENRFDGNTYLLINEGTFSTALWFATAFKDNKMGVVVGAPTHSEVNSYGDIYPFDLPNSGLWAWCSAKRFIRPSGEMTTGGLQPDYLVEGTPEEVVDFTVELIEKNLAEAK